MDEHRWLTDRFEENQRLMHAVAHRMLGSRTEADDAVQEAWLRVRRADPSGVENVAGWLTTIVGRVCLDVLRSRHSRRSRERSLDICRPEVIETRRPDGRQDVTDPEREAELADSVGLALLVVLDTLEPAERLAFVLHDMFAIPFRDIAPILERTPSAARQLASRARRRVRGQAPSPGGDMARQRRVVDAFLAAARQGNLEELVSVLAPGVVVRSDAEHPGKLTLVQGADAAARGARTFAPAARSVQPVLVGGSPGILAIGDDGQPRVIVFTVEDGLITVIDMITNLAQIGRIEIVPLDD